MINELKQSLWSQFGATIDMLEHAIQQCPERFFIDHKKYFYLSFHSLVFLDYYLTIPPKDFSPVLSFTLKEPHEIPEDAIDDVIPDLLYSKSQLLEYVHYCREKAQNIIMGLTEHKLNERFIEEFESGGMNYSLLEIFFYNMRHVQHHVGQLNMLLRQSQLDVPKWVSRAK